MSKFQTIYIVFAGIFIIWQGYLYYKWHPREYEFWSTLHIKEVLLNTLGSFIGWMAGYYLFFYRINNLFIANTTELKFSDFILMLIAFYGMNGELPNIMYNKVINILDLLIKKSSK